MSKLKSGWVKYGSQIFKARPISKHWDSTLNKWFIKVKVTSGNQVYRKGHEYILWHTGFYTKISWRNKGATALLSGIISLDNVPVGCEL